MYHNSVRVAAFGGSQIDGSHDEHIPLLIGDVYKHCVSVVIYLIIIIMTKCCTL